MAELHKRSFLADLVDPVSQSLSSHVSVLVVDLNCDEFFSYGRLVCKQGEGRNKKK